MFIFWGFEMINEWLKKHRVNDWLSERLVCKDGFEMSVQASNVHYCSPRIDNAEYYTTVEVDHHGIELF